MSREIRNSTIEDIDTIFSLYAIATNYQKQKGVVTWPEFERALVEKEIEEKRQWKLMIDGVTVCVWATTFSDPEIWEERNADAAVYIHRIATNPDFRGHNFVVDIVNWSKAYAKQQEKQYVRLDTVGKNEGLIKHYQNSGFTYLGLFPLTNTSSLPAHYHNATVSLFEIRI